MSVPKLSQSSPYPAVSQPSRSANWTHDETQILVDVWEELDQQLTNEDPLLSNKMIIARSIRRLRDMSYVRSQAQVQFKLKQLRHKYRTLAAGRAQGGIGRRAAQWEFYEQIHGIFTRTRSAGAPGAIEPAESQAKRSSTGAKSSSQSSRSVLPPKSSASDTGASPSGPGGHGTAAAGRRAGSQPGTGPPVVPSLPDVPESGEEDDDDFDDDDDELDEAEADEIQDLFGQIQDQDAENETDMSAEMSAETNGKKTVEPSFASFTPTAKSNKRSAASSSSQPNPKKPRGRPRGVAPPRDDLTVAQAITDAVMRFIDHQSFHLTEQTKLLQRYLKFERARMRWEMDMETRRMKWEEEREMREEERRQREEEHQAKRVSDNREFMLQMAVVLGNGGAAAKTKDSTKN